MHTHQPIVILGGGHMGGALARCWQAAGDAPVHVVGRNIARNALLAAEGIHCHTSLAEAPAETAALVLAIKPQQFSQVRGEVRDFLAGKDTLLVSIMAGVPLAVLRQLSPQAVRAMPNLPAQISESMTVLCAPELAIAAQAAVMQLFEAVGDVAWVETEDALHLATAISGCGPGYVFAFMDALEKAAMAQGMDAALAASLVRQTLRGAALLASDAMESPAQLARNVASPGGVTQAALDVFAQGKLDALMENAVAAAVQRSKALAE